MNKFLLFLYKNKNSNEKKFKNGVKIALHLIIMIIFSFVYYGLEIQEYNNKINEVKKLENETEKQEEIKNLNDNYNTNFLSYLYFSCVVHTTTGFSNDYPNNKKIKHSILIHMLIVFILIFIL